jgi:hypothetical protein
MDTKFTVYKTTNLKNAKFYLGSHKTVNPNDSYLGSGTLLLRAVAKYGEENFKKEVLFVYDNEKEMFDKEIEVVEAAKGDKLCYNLRRGGSGGFDWINQNGLSGQAEGAIKGSKMLIEKLKSDPEFAKTMRNIAAEGRKKKDLLFNEDPTFRKRELARLRTYWPGRKHKKESKRRISETKKGTGVGSENSVFGKVCMRHPVTKKKIRVAPEKVEALKMEGWQVGWKGWQPGE